VTFSPFTWLDKHMLDLCFSLHWNSQQLPKNAFNCQACTKIQCSHVYYSLSKRHAPSLFP
jgi:hypothetical protein